MNIKGWIAAVLLVVICAAVAILIGNALAQGWPPASTYMSKESLEWYSSRKPKPRQKSKGICDEIREIEKLVREMREEYCE